MHEAALVLNQTGDGEGRRAAAARVARDEQVLSIFVRSASVKGDGRSFSREHRLHLAKREGLLGAVGGNAERFTKQHGRVFGQKLTNNLDLSTDVGVRIVKCV